MFAFLSGTNTELPLSLDTTSHLLIMPIMIILTYQNSHVKLLEMQEEGARNTSTVEKVAGEEVWGFSISF